MLQFAVQLVNAKDHLAAKAASLFATKEEEGAALVEYGLLVGLIAVIVVGAVATLGTTIAGYFADINAAL
jgi:pilus assembly protein Flp/PilA